MTLFKQTKSTNKNWTVFGEIQTSTTTFIACLTNFHLISHPFKIHIESHRPMGFITVPRITSPIYRFNLVLQDCLWARWFATLWFFGT